MSSADPMRRYIHDFPEMLRLGWAAELPEGFPLPEAPLTLLGGMGGSGMAGAIGALQLAARGRLGLAWSDPALPDWLTPEDRAVVVSYSGETWEALAMLEAALARRIPVRAVASGGSLAARCAETGTPLFRVPRGMPPRAALPWLLAGLLRAIGAAGTEEVAGAAARLRQERDAPAQERDPARIAASLDNRLPILLPLGPRMAVVAQRWRNQILENAEQAAFIAPLPEMMHNEIMGWPWFRTMGIPVSLVVLVEVHPLEGIDASLIGALEQEAQHNGIPIQIIRPDRPDRLASLLSNVYLADRVSVELAERRGVEATPVAAIQRLRASLRDGSGG